MISRASLAFAIAFIGSTAFAQDGLKPKTASQVFADARDLMNAGSLEVAGDVLKDFLALNPTPQEYLDLEAKYGPTTFLKLRTVPRWYDDPKRNAAFKTEVLEKIVAASIAANETLLKNPNRIAKFIKNLAGPPEEYLFAVAELRRSGDAVVPQLIESLRLDNEPEQRAGVLRAVTELGPEILPGTLAATEGITDEFKLMLLGALSRRPDFLTSAINTDANAIPLLWYLSAFSKTDPSSLRDFAVAKLRSLYATAYDRRSAEDELTRAARPLYERKAKFAAIDSANNRVKLWYWDAPSSAVRFRDATVSQAEEAFGLKYLRWAIERNSQYEPATDLFLAFATSRAVERAKFTDLASADPGAFKLLALAPSPTLIRLLNDAIAASNTPLALGLVQALGDKADLIAGTAELKPGGGTRPPVLVKALDYPDPRVQVAAALALLQIPKAQHGAHARVVDVLKRAIAPDAAAGTKAKALIADPSSVRGDQVAGLLRALGYQVEVFGNGRTLAQRIDRTGDFDLILVDRHIVSPLLADLIPMLRGDANSARRPLMIVASADARAQLGLETVLTRLAALIATTESVDVQVPAIPPVDRRKPIDEIERNRKALVDLRDNRLRELYDLRLARLQRLLESANIKQSDALKRRLDLRLAQLTMAALVAEYDLTDTSAPRLVRDFTQLTDLIRRQTDLDPSVQNVDTVALVRLLQQLERVLTPEMQKTFEGIRSKMDPETLALPRDTGVDLSTEVSLQRIAKAYPGVSVIREPSSRVGFEEDVAAAMPDAAQRPRDPLEKAHTSKAAVEALAKLADGSIRGYDVGPATDALRAALANDDLAVAATSALSHIGSASAQTDLVRVAADGSRKTEVRLAATQAAVWSVQSFGKLATPEVIDNVAKAPGAGALLASELAVLNALLSGKPGELAEAMKQYQPTLPAAAKPKEPAPMPKEEEKKEEK